MIGGMHRNKVTICVSSLVLEDTNHFHECIVPFAGVVRRDFLGRGRRDFLDRGRRDFLDRERGDFLGRGIQGRCAREVCRQGFFLISPPIEFFLKIPGLTKRETL